MSLLGKEPTLSGAYYQTPYICLIGATIRFVRQVILIAALVVGAMLPSGCIGTSNQPWSLVQSGSYEFPQEAKDAGFTLGSVVVEYDIGVDGRVKNLSVVSSDPPDLFDAEALRFVGEWRFRPAHEDGKPVATEGLQSTITFRLEDEDIELPVPE